MQNYIRLKKTTFMLIQLVRLLNLMKVSKNIPFLQVKDNILVLQITFR